MKKLMYLCISGLLWVACTNQLDDDSVSHVKKLPVSPVSEDVSVYEHLYQDIFQCMSNMMLDNDFRDLSSAYGMTNLDPWLQDYANFESTRTYQQLDSIIQNYFDISLLEFENENEYTEPNSSTLEYISNVLENGYCDFNTRSIIFSNNEMSEYEIVEFCMISAMINKTDKLWRGHSVLFVCDDYSLYSIPIFSNSFAFETDDKYYLLEQYTDVFSMDDYIHMEIYLDWNEALQFDTPIDMENYIAVTYSFTNYSERQNQCIDIFTTNINIYKMQLSTDLSNSHSIIGKAIALFSYCSNVNFAYSGYKSCLGWNF